jgi:hypothetical protein
METHLPKERPVAARAAKGTASPLRSPQREHGALRSYVLANPALLQVLNRELKRVDLGIRKMQIQAGPVALFEREGLTIKFLDKVRCARPWIGARSQ